MEEPRVRLVRCPKCENLLPELADYNIYQCGGCDAVLCAGKAEYHAHDASLEEEDERNDEHISSETQNLSEEVITSSNYMALGNVEQEVTPTCCNENYQHKDGSESRACSRFPDQKIPMGEKVGAENEGSMNMKLVDDSVAGKDVTLSSRSDSVSEEQHDEEISCMENGSSSRFTSPHSCRSPLMNYSGQFAPNSVKHLEEDRMHLFGKLDELKEQGNGILDVTDKHRNSKILDLERDRSELLNKLDELKEQLRASCVIPDKHQCTDALPKHAETPPDPSGTPSNGCSLLSADDPVRANLHDKCVTGTSCFEYHRGAFPYRAGQEAVHRTVLPHKSPHTDHFCSQMQQPPPQCVSGHHQPTCNQPANHFDANCDLFDPYSHNTAFPHPCPCSHCCNGYPAIARSFPHPPLAPCNSTCHSVSNGSIFRNETRMTHGFCNSGCRGAAQPPSTIRKQNEHDSRTCCCARSCADKRTSGGARVFFNPIAGGAPFITCFNCFELLRLPSNITLKANIQQKIRCGVCSAIITFIVADKKLVLSLPSGADRLKVNSLPKGRKKDCPRYCHGQLDVQNSNFSSFDYDNSGCDITSVAVEHEEQAMTQDLNPAKPQNLHTLNNSSSTCVSEDENAMFSVAKQSNGTVASPPPPGSPLQQHFDYSSNNHVENRLEKGNQSNRTEQERMVANKDTTRQTSLKDISPVSEMDVAYQDDTEEAVFPVAQYSLDAKAGDKLRGSKGNESFLANIFKKSLKDFTRSNETSCPTQRNVYVNGRFIPYHLVKKAEKVTGPIHPGNYWYDFQAGFWGVMGGPCLGIIPPFVEELKHSMPEKCAGGNTGVFVNGRELHQKDLELLAGRGLPTDRDRSYIIEITGRLVDEDTGQELDGLGRLAPTVEKLRRGFGMKMPKAEDMK